MSSEPRERCGRYELIERIALGGMAEVWRAVVYITTEDAYDTIWRTLEAKKTERVQIAVLDQTPTVDYNPAEGEEVHTVLGRSGLNIEPRCLRRRALGCALEAAPKPKWQRVSTGKPEAHPL